MINYKVYIKEGTISIIIHVGLVWLLKVNYLLKYKKQFINNKNTNIWNYESSNNNEYEF